MKSTLTCTIARDGRSDEYGRPLTAGATYTGPAAYVLDLVRQGFATVADVSSFRDDMLALAPRVIILAQQNTQVVAPTDTTNESTLFSFTLPGGLLGPNDSLRIGAHMSCDNNANSKILRVRFGGSIALSSGTVTTAAYSHMNVIIANRNSRTAQTTRMSYSYAGANGGPLAINTTVDQLITVTIQKGVATDNAALESVMVEWLPAAG
jgi:hypothetical protein